LSSLIVYAFIKASIEMTNYRWAGVTAASTEWSSGHGKRRIVIFGKNHF